ncbi:zinc transporter ZIP13 [Patella vulgata]|uniref:zinc transporter ZIP13 n=1 Tax=Patella vulgata TaxID=6465 RepID=UPI00217FEC8B|nr:zinc transporter ZIP13 [Patella vulgata]
MLLLHVRCECVSWFKGVNLISPKTMGCYQVTLILLIILMIFISVSAADIHRTKTTLHRTKSRRDSNSVQGDVASDWDSTNENMLLGHLTYETWCYSLFSAVLVGLSGIFPLLVIPIEAGPSLKHGAAATRLKLLLSFAVGALLGDVFLHLLPEAWGHLDKDSGPQAYTNVGLWVIAGILMFLIIEKTFGEKDDDDDDDKDDDEDEIKEIQEKDKTKQINNSHSSTETLRQRNHLVNDKIIKNNIQIIPRTRQSSLHKIEKIAVSGYLNLLANVIDNFTHGLAVGGSYLVSKKVGLVTTLAILLHEIPHEIGDFAILLKSGFNRWRAAKAQLLTASGGILGAITALCAETPEAAGDRTAWILPFTSGGFLYIALVTVVPDLLQERKGRESLKQVISLICGVSSMVMVTYLFD